MGEGALRDIPEFFGRLVQMNCAGAGEIERTKDGFFVLNRALSELFESRGIRMFPSGKGEELAGRLFLDDWYLYAVCGGGETTYSLIKLREQEYDAKKGLKADADTPGVTVSFVALRTEPIEECLRCPDTEKRKAAWDEIGRVSSRRGQTHSRALKKYFVRSCAQGPYLTAEIYIRHIASFAKEGSIKVPECYAQEYRKSGLRGRVARFIEENNRRAGRTVCDHRRIFFEDARCPSGQEKMAVLATHAGNTSLFSFAAEVQFHALFLTWWAKIPVPIVWRSAYSSAIRADMSIETPSLPAPTPYYRENSILVRRQYECHKDMV